MKKKFQTQLGAIDWIAHFAKDETQFEVLREQLMYNKLYSGEFFVELDKREAMPEVIWLK